MTSCAVFQISWLGWQEATSDAILHEGCCRPVEHCRSQDWVGRFGPLEGPRPGKGAGSAQTATNILLTSSSRRGAAGGPCSAAGVLPDITSRTSTPRSEPSFESSSDVSGFTVLMSITSAPRSALANARPVVVDQNRKSPILRNSGRRHRGRLRRDGVGPRVVELKAISECRRMRPWAEEEYFAIRPRKWTKCILKRSRSV
jgi:hypothetical protein